jgi:hypothetical protein
MRDEKEKESMRDFINCILAWDWSMTAAGLFSIDKGLWCGVT